MQFHEIFSSLRHSPLSMGQVVSAIIEVAANLAGKAALPEAASKTVNFESVGNEALVKAAAQALVDAPLEQRMSNLSAMLDASAARDFGDCWIRSDAAEELTGLLGHAQRARFSYPASIRPALIFALQSKQMSSSSTIEYAGWERDKTLVGQLAAILNLDIIINDLHPWVRSVTGGFDAELTMSPFGFDMSRSGNIPDATLSRLGVFGERHGRLSAESVAIADALEYSAGRVVLTVSDGALFRAVGVEAVARTELVQSGRLHAVMAVGPSMMFQNTAVNSSLIVLSPKGSENSTVRFVNLADEQFASRRERGRLEIRAEANWASLEHAPLIGSEIFARDVDIPSIAAEGCTLTADRYLDRQARDAIAQLLAKSETMELADLVEIIRPTPLTHLEGGECTVKEAAPADVGENGYVSEPSRTITIDRVQLRKASSQQLRPGDVVMAFKGTVGKVGIVSANLPADGASAIWTAGQSLMILRSKARYNLSPQVLLEFLSNEVVQEHLKSLAGGSAIQTIAMKDLKSLAIPIPDLETQDRIQAAVAKRQELYKQIEQLKTEISVIRRSGWPYLEKQSPHT